MNTQWYRATSPDEAIRLILHGATPVGGATALYSEAFTPRLGAIAVLLGWDPGPIEARRVDALTRLDTLAASSTVPTCLRDAARATANQTVRRRATVGGWLGLRAISTDIVPPLVALDARVQLMAPNGEVTMKCHNYLLQGFSEPHLITGILLPQPMISAYRRIPIRATPGPMLLAAAGVRTANRTAVAVVGPGRIISAKGDIEQVATVVNERVSQELADNLSRPTLRIVSEIMDAL